MGAFRGYVRSMNGHYMLVATVVMLCGTGVVTAQELKGQYKKQHRPIMAQLGRGEFDDALKALRKLARKAPGDAETQYCLAMAYSAKGEGKIALGHARKAVASGLAVERLVAGPRSLNKALLRAQGHRHVLGRLRGHVAVP